MVSATLITILVSVAIGAGALAIFMIWRIIHVVENGDWRRVAIVTREQQDIGNNGRYVIPTRTNLPVAKLNLLYTIEKKAKKSVAFFGGAGSGKSTGLRYLCWAYTRDYQQIGLEYAITVFCFNYHRFAKGAGDFEGLGFDFIDISKNIPNVFAPENFEILCRAFATTFVSVIKSQGIMSSLLEDCLRETLQLKNKPCKSWADVIKNAEVLEKESDGIKSQVFGIIATKIIRLDAGIVNEVQIDFTRSAVLDFSLLNDDLCKDFFSEFYAELIYRKAIDESVSGRPHSIAICIDEAQRLLKYSDRSVLVDILQGGRKHIRCWLATHVYTSLVEQSRHFQHFQFLTQSDEDKKAITALVDLHGDSLRFLNETEFVWINDGNTTEIPIYTLSLDIMNKDLEQVTSTQQKNNVYVPPVAEVEVSSDAPPQVDNIVEMPQKNKEELKEKIIDMLQNDAVYLNQINTKLGLGRDDTTRFLVKDIVKSLVANNEIRIAEYVTSKKNLRPRKLYFINKDRAETSVHRQGVEDIKQVCKNLGEKIIGTYQFNQGWDIELEFCYCDFKTGFSSDVKDDVRKLQDSKKPVVFVCLNYDVKQRYENTLSVVDGMEGKYGVCCLDTLADTIRELKK